MRHLPNSENMEKSTSTTLPKTLVTIGHLFIITPALLYMGTLIIECEALYNMIHCTVP
jgi:hypothetical protein